MSFWHIIINCTNCKAALMPARLMLDTNRKKGKRSRALPFASV